MFRQSIFNRAKLIGRLIRKCSSTPQPSLEIHKPSVFPDKPVQSIIDESKLPPSPEITPELIHHLERLSLVRFTDAEAVNHLLIAIRYAQRLAQIDTDQVEPMYTVLEDERLRLRQDESPAGETADRNAILSNAVKSVEEMYFVTPIGNVPLEEREDKIDQRQIKKLRNKSV